MIFMDEHIKARERFHNDGWHALETCRDEIQSAFRIGERCWNLSHSDMQAETNKRIAAIVFRWHPDKGSSLKWHIARCLRWYFYKLATRFNSFLKVEVDDFAVHQLGTSASKVVAEHREFEQFEITDSIESAMQQLSKTQRYILRAHFWPPHQTLQQIAESLNISKGLCVDLFHHAQDDLRELLADQFDGRSV
jgi:DNA-directed RNA polymerase specialized sigma24 family protein